MFGIVISSLLSNALVGVFWVGSELGSVPSSAHKEASFGALRLRSGLSLLFWFLGFLGFVRLSFKKPSFCDLGFGAGMLRFIW
jgi:hypothetical protein